MIPVFLNHFRRPKVYLADIALPFKDECEHFLIAGKTGSGKSQAINQMLGCIRARPNKALLADADGDHLSRFYKPGDLILNGFDSRSVAWSPFAEIRNEGDYSLIASAVIPEGEGESKEWRLYARQLFTAVFERLHKSGMPHTHQLLHYLNAASREDLSVLLIGTSIEQMTRHENIKMFGNTRAVLSAYLSSWYFLRQAEGEGFSIRRWVQSQDPSWLFITYQAHQLPALKPLISFWLDLALVEGLSLPQDLTHRLWYVLDELDSLGKIAMLKDALTKLRKHGGSIVAGLQTISQLRETYGVHTAQTLLSNMSTKLILTTGDSETADYLSAQLGQREVVRHQESKTRILNKGQSTTASSQQQTEWLVLPSELMNLRRGHGYMRVTGIDVIGQVKVPFRSLRQVTPAFEAHDAVCA